MKKAITIIVTIIVATSFALGQQITRKEAIAAAMGTLKNNGCTNIINENMSSVHTLRNGDTILMYEVVFKTGEMVLLSGNKSCQPVLGYRMSEKKGDTLSILDNYDMLPCGLRDLLGEYAEEIGYCFRNEILTDYYNSNWQELLSAETKSGNRTIIVGPLLTTRWGQNQSNDGWDCAAYNYYVTATLNTCSCNSLKCPTGCVATAMAQVMNYWKHPVYMSDSVKQYDWCNMPDSLLTNRPNYTNERSAIAKLMKDCGTTVNMDYCGSNQCSSGAYTPDVPDALETFGYTGAVFKSKKSHAKQWVTLLKNDLDNNYPIIYRAHDSSNGGHAFVCDGYDSNDNFHFNWGWNGNYDDWFTLNLLNPYIFIFDSSHGAVFNIHPNSSSYIDYCDYNLSLDSYYQNYYNTLGHTTPQPYQNVPKTATVLSSATASSPSSWRTIPANQTAEYVAHEEILLQDGFLAETNSNFYAHIVPCEQCTNRETTRGNNNLYSETENDETKDGFIERIPSTGIILHPNPTTGMLHIAIDTDKAIRQVEVRNLPGAIMLKTTTPQGNTIDVSSLPAGVYIVRVVTTEGKEMFAKLVKK